MTQISLGIARRTLIVLVLSYRGSYYHYFRMIYSPAPESNYIYFLGSRKKSKLKLNNRETNENMLSNSTRTKFVNKIPCFMRKYLLVKYISKIKTKIK